jgi:outer membrane lipoprotein-sorting protein
MMEDRTFEDIYTASINGDDIIDDHECWIMDLTAKEEDVAYHAQKIWVDKEYHTPRKQQLYAKSGKLLKVIELSDHFSIGERWYPKRMLFQDVLLKGKGTEFIIDEIEFDVEIPEHIFSKASLRR